MATKKKEKKTTKKVIKRARKPRDPEENPQVNAADDKAAALMLQLRKPEKWLDVKCIDDEPKLHEAAPVLKWCKDFKAQVEQERKELVNPLNAVVKKINAKFKAVTSPVDNIAQHLQGLMGDYDYRLREAERKKVEREAKAAEKRGELEFAEDIRENALREKQLPKLEGLTAKDRWSAEVTDLGAVVVAMLEGNPALAEAKREVKEVLEKHLSRLARAVKRENIGVTGARGVRETSFDNRS
jgi:hypothetical protein